jgi:hypothetical protein
MRTKKYASLAQLRNEHAKGPFMARDLRGKGRHSVQHQQLIAVCFSTVSLL